MAPRKVGNTPFNLQAFFQWSDSIHITDAAIKKSFEDYLKCLRELCDDEMPKTGNTRPGLASLVGEACYQEWRRQLSKRIKGPWPFTDVEKKKKRSMGISEEQYDCIKNGQLDTSADLIAYLQHINQIPQPKVVQLAPPPPSATKNSTANTATTAPKTVTKAPAPNMAMAATPKSKASTTNTAMAATPKTKTKTKASAALKPVIPSQEQPSPEYEPQPTQTQKPTGSAQRSTLDWDEPVPDEMVKVISDVHKTHEESIESKSAESKTATECSILGGSTESPSPGVVIYSDDSDEEPEQGLTSITDYDYWAVPDPQWPGCFLEAPKLPGCGPWELRLPDAMDPEIYIRPDIEEICHLLGGIRLVIKHLPPSITVMPTLPQRDAMKSDKSEDSLITQAIQATRWRAFRLLLLWAKHVRQHAKPPAGPPMSMVEFIERQVREDIIKQGEVDRDFVASHIAKRLQRGLAAFPGRNYQMPKRPIVSEDEPDAKRQRSATYSLAPSKVGQDEDTRIPSPLREQTHEQEETKSSASDTIVQSSIRHGYRDSTISSEERAKNQHQNPMDIDTILNYAINTALEQSGHVEENYPYGNDHVGGSYEEGEVVEHLKQEKTLDF